MRRFFSARRMAGLTAAAAAAGLLFSDSNAMLEQSEKKSELSDVDPSKSSQVENGSQTSSEDNESSTPPSQSPQDSVYGIFFPEAVKQKLLGLYPAKFSNIIADRVLLSNVLSPEDQIELEKMLGTKYQVCVCITLYMDILLGNKFFPTAQRALDYPKFNTQYATLWFPCRCRLKHRPTQVTSSPRPC